MLQKCNKVTTNEDGAVDGLYSQRRRYKNSRSEKLKKYNEIIVHSGITYVIKSIGLFYTLSGLCEVAFVVFNFVIKYVYFYTRVSHSIRTLLCAFFFERVGEDLYLPIMSATRNRAPACKKYHDK